jgi:hypothetical protein
MTQKPRPAAAPASAAKKDRLAAALKANLQRRKAAAKPKKGAA